MGEHILLVDDDPGFLELLRPLLEQAGYRVSTAETPDAAVSLVRLDRPDLILLDINLPRLDGYDVCEMLQIDKVPFLFLSGLPFREQQNQVAFTGARGYLEKPIRPDVLLAQVRKALSPASIRPPY